MTTTPTAKERAQEATSTAADEGKRVGSVAKDEISSVAGEASTQARNVVNEAMTQVGEQSRTQVDKLVSTLSTLSDDLESMASQSQGGLAADLAKQAASRTRGIVSQMENREPADLLDDVRSFARNKPGVFLLGALAAGVVAGRMTRGIKDAASQGSSSGYSDTQAISAGASGYGGTGYAGTTGLSTGTTPALPPETSTTVGTAPVETGYDTGVGTGLGTGTGTTGLGTGTGTGIGDDLGTGTTYPRTTP